MKTCLLLFVACFCIAISASAQNIGGSALNAHPQMLVLADSTERASQTPMATEHDLLEHGGSTSARGERPLWEVMPESPKRPLGDIARELKLEHESARKALIVWVN
jgi:hypothetical protein